MKSNYILSTRVLIMFMLCSIGISTSTETYAQKTRTRLTVYYEKLSNDDKELSITLIQGRGKQMSGVEDAEIFLTAFNQGEELELTSLVTDSNGEADLIIESGYIFPLDENGYAAINVAYNGNDSLRATTKQIKFMDLNVDLSFDVVDSTRQVVVSAFQLDSVGNRKPINEIQFKIGVERLYSILYLENVETDEDGEAIMEFPNDLPGDSIGTVKVIVKLDEHDDYGTIIRSAEANWGTIVDYTSTSDHRSLFGDNAPLWMIISVAVILTGAWFHFILAIYKVFKIKRLAQNSV